IWLIPSAGGNPHNITKHPGSNDQPRWFPDGSKIAFRSDRTRNREREKYFENGRYAVFTVSMEKEPDKANAVEAEDEPPVTPTPQGASSSGNIDFSDIENRAKQIVALDEPIGAICISPDGKSIAFRATTQGQSELWSVAAGGGTLNRLAAGTGASTSPI